MISVDAQRDNRQPLPGATCVKQAPAPVEMSCAAPMFLALSERDLEVRARWLEWFSRRIDAESALRSRLFC